MNFVLQGSQLFNFMITIPNYKTIIVQNSFLKFSDFVSSGYNCSLLNKQTYGLYIVSHNTGKHNQNSVYIPVYYLSPKIQLLRCKQVFTDNPKYCIISKKRLCYELIISIYSHVCTDCLFNQNLHAPLYPY